MARSKLLELCLKQQQAGNDSGDLTQLVVEYNKLVMGMRQAMKDTRRCCGKYMCEECRKTLLQLGGNAKTE